LQAVSQTDRAEQILVQSIASGAVSHPSEAGSRSLSGLWNRREASYTAIR
jgi:hypothetical protein